MKNIEKYHYTQEALDVYNSLSLNNVPFNEWLECEYEEPREKTLLEAAEAVTDEWYDIQQNINCNDIGEIIVDLENAIAREKAKPVRNFNKYKTANEAFNGFREMCFCNSVNECKDCPFNNVKKFGICVFAYLYAEAEKAR